MSTDIRGLMQFERGEIVSITLTPNEKKDPTVSLKLSAELTPQTAGILGIRDSVFRSDDKPHARVTRLDLGGMILRDVDLTLPNAHNGGFDVYRPEDIASFRIEVEGMLARLYMLARIKNRYLDIADWFENTNTDTFQMAIRSLQDEFDFSGKSGGTRVEISGNQNVAAGKAEENGPLFQAPDDAASDPAVEAEGGPTTVTCALCEQSIPKNEDGMHMIAEEGREDLLSPCLAVGNAVAKGVWMAEQFAEATRGPAIVDVRDMGMGTRLRRRLTRGDGNISPEAIRAEQARAGQIVDADPFGVDEPGIPVEDEPVIPVGAE